MLRLLGFYIDFANVGDRRSTSDLDVVVDRSYLVSICLVFGIVSRYCWVV